MASIMILGAGGFGISLAVMSVRYGHTPTLWSPFEDEVEYLTTNREHPKLLKDIKIPAEVLITSNLSIISNQDLCIIATPSFAVRQTAKQIAPFLRAGMPVACVSKGLELDTLKTLSQVLDEELPTNNPAVIISGPSHAEEVARGIPTTVVAASRNRAAAEFVQDTLMNETLRIYANDDVLGVEYGGALKNIIALAAGILDGQEAGDNTKAALMTRGIAEIARLGVALGAKAETFAGLSGIGDLIVTCSSMHSRNRRCGILIGQGIAPTDAVAQIGMTVEGYPCTKAAHQLAAQYKIYMPIVEETYKVLYEGKEVKVALKNLMEKPKRHESEVIWLLSK